MQEKVYAIKTSLANSLSGTNLSEFASSQCFSVIAIYFNGQTRSKVPQSIAVASNPVPRAMPVRGLRLALALGNQNEVIIP